MSIISGEDISTEILLRLPIMSILNLKTVSKLWLSIVSTPRFRQTYASRRTDSTVTGLFFVRDNGLHYGTLGFLPTGRNNPKLLFHDIRVDPNAKNPLFRCTSSCNGLILLKSSEFESPLRVEHHMYYIYNPATEQCKKIDIPTRMKSKEYSFGSACLAFDPSESPHYKVAVLWSSRILRELQIEVYSSMTGQCKPPKRTFGLYGEMDELHRITGFYCNGSVYWRTRNPSSVLCFDVDSEKIKTIPVPPSRFGICCYFGPCRDNIIFAEFDEYVNNYISNCFNIYDLNRDYSGSGRRWVLKYRVEHDRVVQNKYSYYSWVSKYQRDRVMQNKYSYYSDFYRAMNIFVNEEGDLSMVVLVGEEWVEYNLAKKTTKKLCELPSSYYNSSFPWTEVFHTHQFIPTLTFI